MDRETKRMLAYFFKRAKAALAEFATDEDESGYDAGYNAGYDDGRASKDYRNDRYDSKDACHSCHSCGETLRAAAESEPACGECKQKVTRYVRRKFKHFFE